MNSGKNSLHSRIVVAIGASFALISIAHAGSEPELAPGQPLYGVHGLSVGAQNPNLAPRTLQGPAGQAQLSAPIGSGSGSTDSSAPGMVPGGGMVPGAAPGSIPMSPMSMMPGSMGMDMGGAGASGDSSDEGSGGGHSSRSGESRAHASGSGGGQSSSSGGEPAASGAKAAAEAVTDSSGSGCAQGQAQNTVFPDQFKVKTLGQLIQELKLNINTKDWCFTQIRLDRPVPKVFIFNFEGLGQSSSNMKQMHAQGGNPAKVNMASVVENAVTAYPPGAVETLDFVENGAFGGRPALECALKIKRTLKHITADGKEVEPEIAGFGYSNGGRELIKFAEGLKGAGYRMKFAYTVAPAPKGLEQVAGALTGWDQFLYKPSNVDYMFNDHETSGFALGGNVKGAMNCDVELNHFDVLKSYELRTRAQKVLDWAVLGKTASPPLKCF